MTTPRLHELGTLTQLVHTHKIDFIEETDEQRVEVELIGHVATIMEIVNGENRISHDGVVYGATSMEIGFPMHGNPEEALLKLTLTNVKKGPLTW